MEHVVFFHGPDGSEQYRRASGLEEAVRHVEHLRNTEGVGDCRVYSLAEVPLRVKTVYVVEVPSTEEPAPAEAPSAEAEAEPEPAPEPEMPSEPAPSEPVMSDPLAELTVPAMPDMPAAPEASVPETEFAPVDAPAEPVASNGNGARGLGFFAR